jgi:hypothetical protein
MRGGEYFFAPSPTFLKGLLLFWPTSPQLHFKCVTVVVRRKHGSKIMFFGERSNQGRRGRGNIKS